MADISLGLPDKKNPLTAQKDKERKSQEKRERQAKSKWHLRSLFKERNAEINMKTEQNNKTDRISM